MTADAAVAGIRGADPAGPLALIGAEPHPPYNRPPLSKGLWKGEPEEGIWRQAAPAGAELQLGRRVVGIDLRGHSVTDDRGTVYGFQKLLLATGGEQQLLEPVHRAPVVGDAVPPQIDADHTAAELQLRAGRRRLAPDALLRLSLPQALRERRAIVGGVRLGTDQRQRAGGIGSPDARDRRIRRHPAADDYIRVGPQCISRPPV